MVSIQKGKCFECKTTWYWCKECGAAGCATSGCTQCKRSEERGWVSSTNVCRICGGK